MGEEELRSYVLEVGELCAQATPVGFEPTRGDPIGLAGRRLSRSAKVSLNNDTILDIQSLLWAAEDERRGGDGELAL